MNTVTLSVASRNDVNRRALAAFDARSRGAHISFASAELLWRTLTRGLWELLGAMTGPGDDIYPRGRAAGRSRYQGRAGRRPGADQGGDRRPDRGWGDFPL